MKINCKIYICITHECKKILEESERRNKSWNKNYGIEQEGKILVINLLVR